MFDLTQRKTTIHSKSRLNRSRSSQLMMSANCTGYEEARYRGVLQRSLVTDGNWSTCGRRPRYATRRILKSAAPP